MAPRSRAPSPAVLLRADDPALRDRLLPPLAARLDVQLADDAEALLGALSGARGLLLASDGRQMPVDLELLARVRTLDPWIPIVLLTPIAEPESILRAGRLGVAACFLTSTDPEQIAVEVEALVTAEADALDARAGAPAGDDAETPFLGESQPIRRLRTQAEEVARYPTSVLITGENGTGKEVLARHIHAHSDRAAAEFVEINCAGLPAGLVESELFGHERGSFTGAVRTHRGSFERAQGGTLMLDEITEMPIELQPKLLRALQERAFVRVGGEQAIQADVRPICTTNRDPQRAISEGLLRRDLFYRINVVTLHVPPLREHREDVPLLARYFLRRKCRELGKPITRFTPTAESLMLSHDWPGNVRELENLVERAVVFCRSERIGPELLDPIAQGAAYLALPWDAARDLAVRRFEFGYLSMLMRVHRGSVSECAKAMGISRQALYKLLDRIGLDPESFRPARRGDRRSGRGT
ncbi:MAG: AAA domain-containing protein [Candidatus Eisenbacteria bacterium]|nr:AAA domain-containing protein [Candidatus Eisenbacteria bacterium]